MTTDDPTLDRLQRGLRRLEPDPLFRRRLRGEVLNRYVAVREGMLQAPRRSRQMGRLGRATLYASLGLVISVSAAGAASQRALPGDLLYPMKLQLEGIRMRVAPAQLQDELAAMALEERLDEVEELAASAHWADVARAAPGVAAAERRVAAFGASLGPEGAEAIAHHVAVLQALLADAPAAALPGLQVALDASTHFESPAHGSGSQGAGSHGNGSPGGGNQGSTAATKQPHPTPAAGPSGTPEPHPTPKPKANPARTPQPRASEPVHGPPGSHTPSH